MGLVEGMGHGVNPGLVDCTDLVSSIGQGLCELGSGLLPLLSQSCHRVNGSREKEMEGRVSKG